MRNVIAAGLCLVVLAAGTACSRDKSPTPPAVTAVDFTGVGVTHSDYRLGQARFNEEIIACLRTKGFDLKGPTPRLINSNVLSGEGPVTVAINELEHPESYEFASAATKAPGFAEASSGCFNQAMEARAARTRPVMGIDQRLSAAWTNFQASQEYRKADAKFSQCLGKAGQTPEPLATVGHQLQQKAEGIKKPPTNPEADAKVLAQLKKLLPQEAKLRQAATECWATEMKPTLETYNNRLWQDNSDDIIKLARAIRGEE